MASSFLFCLFYWMKLKSQYRRWNRLLNGNLRKKKKKFIKKVREKKRKEWGEKRMKLLFRMHEKRKERRKRLLRRNWKPVCNFTISVATIGDFEALECRPEGCERIRARFALMLTEACNKIVFKLQVTPLSTVFRRCSTDCVSFVHPFSPAPYLICAN